MRGRLAIGVTTTVRTLGQPVRATSMSTDKTRRCRGKKSNKFLREPLGRSPNSAAAADESVSMRPSASVTIQTSEPVHAVLTYVIAETARCLLFH